jgi:hypothetical protein
MSWLSRIFGGSAEVTPEEKSITYKGFTIFPEPIAEGSHHRIAARIEKEVDGEVKTHQLIRADTLGAREAAVDASLAKAKQVIDEQADRLFR